MSERNIKLLLEDIFDSINYIKTFTHGMDYEAYSSNLQTKHAVSHNLTVIGEASSKLPKELYSLF